MTSSPPPNSTDLVLAERRGSVLLLTLNRPERLNAWTDALEAAIPEHMELTLVHGDFHLLNVIAVPGGEDIYAILDWELCTLGDPLADLGGLLAYWRQAGDATEGPFPARGFRASRRGAS